MDLILLLIGLSTFAVIGMQSENGSQLPELEILQPSDIPPAPGESEPASDDVVEAPKFAPLPDTPAPKLAPLPEDTAETPKFAPLPDTPAAPKFAPLPEPSGFAPEDQTPSGKFTTAGEVKPILSATLANWIGVREYDGQDLIYFTHLLAWRCGLHEIRFAVNDGPEQVFPAEPCYSDTGAPNAIKADTVLPYATAPLKSTESVTVSLLFDDMTTRTERFTRSDVLMP